MRSWYLPDGQCVQFGALLVLEKYVAGHSRQRSGDASVAFASNVPGTHGCFASQYDCPPAFWNLPAGQRSQLAALVVFEKCMAGHGAHVRSSVAFAAETTRSPVAHLVCGRQKPLPAPA